MKLFVRTLILLFLIVTAQSAYSTAEGAGWKLFREVVVEGYVLVGDHFSTSGEEVFDRSPKALYDIVTSAVPLLGAEVRLEEGGDARSGEDGFFRLIVKRWFFQKSQILTVITPMQALKVELTSERGENPFVAVVVNRNGESRVYRRAPVRSPAVPFAFVSMDIFPSLGAGKGGPWSDIINLLKADSVPLEAEYYEMVFREEVDFAHVPALLRRRISALSRIHGGAGVRCAGFGLGALALRHYSVSEYYEPGTIECLIQAAPPNKGLLLPEAVRKVAGERHGRLFSQLDPESRFMEALNKGRGRTDPDVNEYALAPERMDAVGFNPDIRTLIIAGEIMEENKQALRSAGEQFGKSAGAFLDFWKGFMALQGLDPEFFNRLEDAGRELLHLYGKGLEHLPAGDLVVPVEQALVEGVAYKILPYSHFSLLKAEGLEDERYRSVRDFLITER